MAVTLFTGLRQGEVLGLRWSDIDLEARTLTVALALQRLPATETETSRLALVQAKTSRSRRSVSFPPSWPTSPGRTGRGRRRTG